MFNLHRLSAFAVVLIAFFVLVACQGQQLAPLPLPPMTGLAYQPTEAPVPVKRGRVTVATGDVVTFQLRDVTGRSIAFKPIEIRKTEQLTHIVYLQISTNLRSTSRNALTDTQLLELGCFSPSSCNLIDVLTTRIGIPIKKTDFSLSIDGGTFTFDFDENEWRVIR